MEVFNGHFFIRYNERMKLGQTNIVDMIKAFFINCGYLQIERQKGDKEFTVGICKEGIALGNYYGDPEWLVHKTFISRDLARNDQDLHEKALLAKLQSRLLKAQLSGTQDTLAHYQALKQIIGDSVLHIDDFGR
jgi:hypothetical protein